jgi:hypothetical protein
MSRKIATKSKNKMKTMAGFGVCPMIMRFSKTVPADLARSQIGGCRQKLSDDPFAAGRVDDSRAAASALRQCLG